MKKNIISSFILTTLVFAIIAISTGQAKAQMDCRSMLGAHLTPFQKDGSILWGIEGTMGPGVMTSPFDSLGNTQINGGMILGALDFGFGQQKHHFYVEGGYKNWKNSEFVDETSLKGSKHLGVRQAFYSYNNNGTKVKLGLHETRLGDFFLIDERILGASVDQEFGAFSMSGRVGTVNKSFARMGKFCANRHLYSFTRDGFTERIGEKVGETNLAGFVINWDPHYEKPTGSENEFESTDEFGDSDEFSSDDEFSNSSDEFHENHDFNEFGDNDEFAENSTNKNQFPVKVTNVALIFYDEFGSEEYIPNNKLYTGALMDVNLPYGFYIQTGGIYQNMENNNAIVYIAKFGKSKTWGDASLTKISGAYIGKTNVDDNALFQPTFSNLFIGEVMRMDATEFPLWQMAIKHRFSGKMKMHVALKTVGQIEGAKTNEQDIEFGFMAFNNHLKTTLIGSRIESQMFDNEFYMARLELRLAF